MLDCLNEASLLNLSAGGFDPCAVVETPVGNFQASLKHAAVLPKLVGSLAAQILALTGKRATITYIPRAP